MASLDRQILKDLALARREDATVLIQNQRFAAAYYLSGYVVECALKACIARQTREHEFPDKNRVNSNWTHKLPQLLGLTQIPDQRDFGGDPVLEKHWSLVSNRWSEDCRYEDKSEKEAKDLLHAVTDSDHGVLQWLQRHW